MYVGSQAITITQVIKSNEFNLLSVAMVFMEHFIAFRTKV